MAERLSFNDARSEPQPHGRELFRGEAPDEVRAIVFPVRERQGGVANRPNPTVVAREPIPSIEGEANHRASR